MISIPFGSTSRRMTFSSVALTAVAPVVAVALAAGRACADAVDGGRTAASARLASTAPAYAVTDRWDFLAGIIVVSL